MKPGPTNITMNISTSRHNAPTASFFSRKLRRICLPGLTSSSTSWISPPAALAGAFSSSSARWLLPPLNHRPSHLPRAEPPFLEEFFPCFFIIHPPCFNLLLPFLSRTLFTHTDSWVYQTIDDIDDQVAQQGHAHIEHLHQQDYVIVGSLQGVVHQSAHATDGKHIFDNQ